LKLLLLLFDRRLLFVLISFKRFVVVVCFFSFLNVEDVFLHFDLRNRVSEHQHHHVVHLTIAHRQVTRQGRSDGTDV
jgi:hypothetical protein